MSLATKFEESLQEVLDGRSTNFQQYPVSLAEGDQRRFASTLTQAASVCGRLPVRFWTRDTNIRERPPVEEIEVYESDVTSDGQGRVYAVGATGVNGYVLAEGAFQFSFPGEYKRFTFVTFETEAPSP
jgi:hypothetical protein